MQTVAQAIKALLDDGTCILPEGQGSKVLHETCSRLAVGKDENTWDGKTRYHFDDGSTILVGRDSWSIGCPDCWYWPENGSAPHCDHWGTR